MSNRILFISHSAERTGAPIVLLNLMRWLKENTNLEIHILLMGDGPLESQFTELGDVIKYKRFITNQKSISQRILQFTFNYDQPLQQKRRNRDLFNHYLRTGIDLIYANTITNGEILHELEDLQCPIICHVHELDYWIQRCGQENLDLIRKHVSHYIAASKAVKDNLVKNHGIDEEDIDIIYEFIPTEDIQKSLVDPIKFKQEMQLPENVFIVGGAGLETWRKGKDLFIQLAISLKKLSLKKTLKLIWLGGFENEEDRYRLNYDIRQADLINEIIFIDEKFDPYNYFNIVDAFVVISRDDPFPLVGLEAGFLGKPILCFDRSGGMPEFIRNDAGYIVPYLDIGEMALKIKGLIDDIELGRKLGKCASVRVLDLHDINVVAPQIINVIKKVNPYISY